MEPPPAYTSVAGKTNANTSTPNATSNKVLEGRMKIVVGLDYGTTNSGRSEFHQKDLTDIL
jgi:hypothetical protein